MEIKRGVISRLPGRRGAPLVVGIDAGAVDGVTCMAAVALDGTVIAFDLTAVSDDDSRSRA